MSKEQTETGVILPQDGIIDTQWCKEQLSRVDLFSASLLAYGRGEIFFMASSNMGTAGFEQVVTDLGYTVQTANVYINYLQKRTVIEAIRAKYYVALSLAASEFVPDSTEDALALCDICISKYGKLTADNLKKAAEDSGAPIQKMSTSALTVEKLKKDALNEWLLDTHQLSEDDILQASKLPIEGRVEFTEKMLQAYSLLEDFKTFYDIIAIPVNASGSTRALRFLSDLQDASGSITEYLDAETAFNNLNQYKATFEMEIYPKLSFDANKDD